MNVITYSSGGQCNCMHAIKSDDSLNDGESMGLSICRREWGKNCCSWVEKIVLEFKEKCDVTTFKYDFKSKCFFFVDSLLFVEFIGACRT